MNFIPKRPSQLIINLTPMIDVVFLLLIFFMVTTTFNPTGGVEVSLPRGEATSTVTTPLEITITAEGEYFHGGQRKTLQEVVEVLRGNQYPSIVIMADEHVQHGRVVAVMDAAKTHGIEKISIATVVDGN
ncbi:biopolymer transporter ExbD [Desulfurispirillum indicum]|uniref:Biopolymer transport protein ExbD/TolR n=1 Tax=Desulfurispirillum indicum (strain ATCC BAA-1389 / DSM 22839 / S5) TaxID=653733 RepID=E6W799_DESIS|nr:biopolymer transporter ExbD [Desulfurispirillum indicum]ADU66266.1 Biopolymer transport protein ExbD/TolR [Desulfurispirillum indicum S5]UCZ55597.1 biopolymer transporter ExbD [Desulfurispirillum indicum]